MGKTYKDSAKNGGGQPKTTKGTDKPKPVKKEKKVRVAGPKPDYTPKGERAENRKGEYLCHDIGQLFNNLYDKELYVVDGVEISKGMFPLFKEATEDSLFIVADGIPEFHPLALAGVRAGVRIPSFHIGRNYFASKMKDEDMKDAIEAFWKFLRNALVTAPPVIYGEQMMGQPIEITTATTTMLEEIPAVEEAIEREPSTAPRIIWEGSRLGLVEVRGVTFEVCERKVGTGVTTAVKVRSAPMESGLMDAEVSGVYLTIGQLRNQGFESKLEGVSKKAQQTLWTFLRKVADDEGLSAKKEPTKSEEKPTRKYEPVETGYKYRPLSDMLHSQIGFYDLGGVIVKLFGSLGNQQIEVVKIEVDHDLKKHGVESGFSILSKWVADDITSLQRSKDYGKIVALVGHIQSKLIANGVVKSFKKASTPALTPVHHNIAAPQYGKSPRLTLVASDGERIDKIAYLKEKPLAKGFLTASYGHWKCNDGVVFKCWSHDSIWFAKVVSAPEGHALSNYRPFIKLGHLKMEETGLPGKELREYLRAKLREIGDLPSITQQASA